MDNTNNFSCVYWNNNTNELNVSFDDKFNKSIEQFEDILCSLNFTLKDNDCFNYTHSLSVNYEPKKFDNYKFYDNTQFNYKYYGYKYKEEYGCSRINNLVKYDNNLHECQNNLQRFKNDLLKYEQELGLDKKKIIKTNFKNLKKILFGYYFNKSVDKLPNSIEWLFFGHTFNIHILKYPANLKYLTFGYCFNQKISQLPPNLERIVFGCNFNQSIDMLPDSITHLSLFFDCTINYRFGIKEVLRPSAGKSHYSKFAQKIKKLPLNLINLFVQTINIDKLFSLTKLTHLQIYNYSSSLLNLPKTLKQLIIENNNNNDNIIYDELPNDIKILVVNFNKCFSKVIKNLPNNLKTIILKDNYFLNKNNIIDLSNLPTTIEYLSIITNSKIIGIDHLPDSITHLTIDNNIPLLNLPNSITHLFVGAKHKNQIILPANIEVYYNSKEYYFKLISENPIDNIIIL